MAIDPAAIAVRREADRIAALANSKREQLRLGTLLYVDWTEAMQAWLNGLRQAIAEDEAAERDARAVVREARRAA